ncbi:MAG: FAD-dependent oxidoreductase [Elusimicrobiota bacterium]|nr:FAD-dependent oxidoreductase [Elusimicrobiota bacterium]
MKKDKETTGEKKIVILGAGLTGLTAAHFLENPVSGRAKTKPFLLEKKDCAGGLCRTEQKNGFCFDYTGHLLHFKNRDSTWKSFVENTLKINLQRHSRRASIHIMNTLVPYPFQYHLSYLSKKEKDRCVKDYLKIYKNAERPGGSRESFGSWAENSFGKRMASLFFIPYNKKLWNFDLGKMSTAWMGRFVPGPDVKKILRGAEKKDTSRSAGYNASFYYPRRGGIGQLPQALEKGKNIIFNAAVRQIDFVKKKIFFEGGVMAYDKLISTIPLPELLNYLKGSPVKNLAKKLKWTGVYNMNIAVKKDFSKLGHWIYFPHGKVPFYRLGFLSNFSAVPGGFSTIYIESSYRAERKKLSAAAVMKFLNISRSDIAVTKTLDIPYAYVIYDMNREKYLARIRDFFASRDIISTGRFGGWKYSTMEEAMQDGFDAAKEIMSGTVSISRRLF